MSEDKKYLFPQKQPEHPSFEVLTDWWRNLENDTGERAALRRASSLTEIMTSPAYVRLLRTLRAEGYSISSSNKSLSKIATIAGLAARVKTQTSEGLATCMGTPKTGGSTPAFSELRLRNLLARDDLEELYTQLRRALAILDDRANLPDLAATVWNWTRLNDKKPYDPRRRLAYDYYSAAPLKT